MAVGVEDGMRWILDGQFLGRTLPVHIVFSVTVGDEVGSLVDKYSGFGISTGVGGPPEGTTEMDLSIFLGI